MTESMSDIPDINQVREALDRWEEWGMTKDAFGRYSQVSPLAAAARAFVDGNLIPAEPHSIPDEDVDYLAEYLHAWNTGGLIPWESDSDAWSYRDIARRGLELTLRRLAVFQESGEK